MDIYEEIRELLDSLNREPLEVQLKEISEFPLDKILKEIAESPIPFIDYEPIPKPRRTRGKAF